MKIRKRILRRLGYRLGLLPSQWGLPCAIKIIEWREAWSTLPEGGRFERVLDVGCGAAIQAQLIQDRAGSVVGIDSALDHLLFADEMRRLGRPRVRVDLVNGTTSAIASESCDLVLSLGVLEHTDDPCSFLNDCARVLAPGGRLVITADSQNGAIDPDLLERFRALYDVRRLFSRAELVELLAAAGLEDIEARYILRSRRSVDVLRHLVTSARAPSPIRRIWQVWAIDRAERSAPESGGQMALATARRPSSA